MCIHFFWSLEYRVKILFYQLILVCSFLPQPLLCICNRGGLMCYCWDWVFALSPHPAWFESFIYIFGLWNIIMVCKSQSCSESYTQNCSHHASHAMPLLLISVCESNLTSFWVILPFRLAQMNRHVYILFLFQ